jgi:hypothetical protein
MVVLIPAGCGLANYESRLEMAQKQAQHLDEEEKYLGKVAEMPKLPSRDSQEQSWNVFLRLPREISEKPASQKDSPLAQLFGELAVYEQSKDSAAGTGRPTPGPGGKVGAAGSFQNVYLGVAATDRKDFAKEVMQLFPAAGEPHPENVTLRSPQRQMTISRYIYDDTASSLSINFYQRGKTQVAVVYRVTRGGLTPQSSKPSELSKAIELSMLTLGLDEEVVSLRTEYDKTHKSSRPPTTTAPAR